MKPYKELTRLGRLRRLRRLAQVALDDYGLGEAKLTFLHYEGNVIFRVDKLKPFSSEDGVSPYVQDRYALRIHSMDDAQAIASELTWLAALSREAGLPVPEPVQTLDGKLLTRVSTPGVPHGRVVSIMRWLDGRQLTKGLRTHHARIWGRMVAKLHKFAAVWQPPQGFKRPQWDWEGLLGEGELVYPTDELVAEMPARYREPFTAVSQQVRKVMQAFGKGPQAFGMIHADMYQENILFKAGEIYPIDFEDCGFGYWMFDIGVVLSQWRWKVDWLALRDAFLEGYAQVHSLPELQLKHLNLFIATQYAQMTLWATAFIRHDPAMQVEHKKWRAEFGEQLLRYFNDRSL